MSHLQYIEILKIPAQKLRIVLVLLNITVTLLFNKKHKTAPFL